MSTTRTLVVDNGASLIKCGYADDNTYKTIPNNITRSKTERKTFIGDQLETCKDFSGLYYRLPFEKGMLTSWDVEKQVWDRMFTGKALPCEPSSTTLVISEPVLNLPNIAATYDQLVFEEYNFHSYTRLSAPQMALKSPRANRILQHYVLPDYSAQQTGYIKGKRKAKKPGKKKAANNMDVDADRDLEKDQDAQSEVSDDDHDDSDVEMGAPNEDEQVLTMNNERFTVPEILFHPSDIGMEQAGIPEAIVDAISACDDEIQGMLYANIVLIGGNTRLPGFKKRVANDLRQLAPSEYEVRVGIDKDPLGYAWKGATRLATMDEFASEFKNRIVTRAEYLENGSAFCESRFRSVV
ncbi:Actin- protein 6 [Mortierella sp. GBA43]|nr:Actin- protein 6 [Mortierella sp. GBA43]